MCVCGGGGGGANIRVRTCPEKPGKISIGSGKFAFSCSVNNYLLHIYHSHFHDCCGRGMNVKYIRKSSIICKLYLLHPRALI